MEGIYLVNYKVKGIKCIDDTVELSFYKKTITKTLDFSNYNIKGIYGVNGSGKTAIISSVKMLKDILFYPNYFTNELNQKKLHELINKKTKKTEIEVEFIVKFDDMPKPLLYRYNIEIGLSQLDIVVILSESLSYKTATSKSSDYKPLIKITRGIIESLKINDSLKMDEFNDKTKNLLLYSTVCSLFYLNYFSTKELTVKDLDGEEFFMGCFSLMSFGISLHVYLDDKDLHHSYMIYEFLSNMNVNTESYKEYMLINSFKKTNYGFDINHSVTNVQKKKYSLYQKEIKGLERFLQIFKNDLKGIDIDKKINGDVYECRLILEYDNYGVNSEFESTGIKKLIDLYQYFKAMVNGDLVFIDELDSNLHDVYLCALLEYLSTYGKGQVCFTSHNIGPMDVLRKKKKSIDFLSVDNSIHSWTVSGNYSPATLYRNGMIDGSPFNINKVDFIGLFEAEEE